MDVRTPQAMIRFGLGRRGTEALPQDPVAWLSDQIRGPDPTRLAAPSSAVSNTMPSVAPNTMPSVAPKTAPGTAPNTMSTTELLTALSSAPSARSGSAASSTPPSPTSDAPPGMAPGTGPSSAPSTAQGLAALRQDRLDKPPPGQSAARALYRTQGAGHLETALTTPAPFRERLVWFWTNHFTISLRRGECAALVGAFVEEAIRPHVTGRFQDMLLAVMRHPAMLLYLDNAGSVGPNSQAGQRRHLGLNENLARECMELHTVSPAAGYTQADVTNFAKILTGWSVERNNDPLGFRFHPAAHEPGEQTVLGNRFPDGEAGGVAALTFLASHPATHRHLATQLVRHFVADQPPPEAVRVIEGRLRDTGGNLGAASLALIELPAAWQPGAKLRTPTDYVVAAVRCLDLPPDNRPNMLGLVALLGQPLWTAPAPNGWPDQSADWAAPEAMMRRIDWANAFAGRVGQTDVAMLADASLGALLRPETGEAIRRAGSRHDALTLLLASPEFQRR